MRVIAGECKGRRLKAVPGSSTRPTTDKIKESIFNMIGPFFDGGRGLDLYSGSGGLAIEALSRGLDEMIMIDSDPKAIETIRFNLEQLNYVGKAEVFRNDAERALKAIVKRELSFHLIFLDPPYRKQKIEKMVAFIEEQGLLDQEGIIVAEHGGDIDLPECIGKLVRERYEKYSGTTAVSIYQYRKE